jgi:hypothetical protein
MISNSAFIAGMVLLVATFATAEQVTFLAPYKRLLFDRYWSWLLVFAGVLYLNLFAGCYLLSRRLFLKETGRKLAHLERQLQSGDSIVRDLSERLAAEE